MIKCLLSRPGLISGPLHSTPLQINSQSIPRLDPIDSIESSLSYIIIHLLDVWKLTVAIHFVIWWRIIPRNIIFDFAFVLWERRECGASLECWMTGGVWGRGESTMISQNENMPVSLLCNITASILRYRAVKTPREIGILLPPRKACNDTRDQSTNVNNMGEVEK